VIPFGVGERGDSEETCLLSRKESVNGSSRGVAVPKKPTTNSNSHRNSLRTMAKTCTYIRPTVRYAVADTSALLTHCLCVNHGNPSLHSKALFQHCRFVQYFLRRALCLPPGGGAAGILDQRNDAPHELHARSRPTTVGRPGTRDAVPNDNHRQRQQQQQHCFPRQKCRSQFPPRRIRLGHEFDGRLVSP